MPDLRTITNEALIPFGAWSVILNARRFDVRYVTFRRASNGERDIKHLSYYSQVHKDVGKDDVEFVRDDVRTLCNLPFKEGAVFFDERSHGRASVCHECDRIARARGYAIMEEVREGRDGR